MRWKELPEEINGFKIIQDLGRLNGATRKAIVKCKVCDRIYEAQAYYLKDRKHCGCLRPKEMICSYRRSHPRLVTIYKCMRARCYYENDVCYRSYGGKGIQVCEDWLKSPDLFCKWSLDNGYQDYLSIDRKNNALNYTPENCQWSNAKDQAANRKGIKLSMEKARMIRKEIIGSTVKELASKYDVAVNTISRILNGKRWPE